jgi:hypothetical protein
MVCGLRRAGQRTAALKNSHRDFDWDRACSRGKSAGQVEPVRRIHDQNLQKRYVTEMSQAFSADYQAEKPAGDEPTGCWSGT